MRTGVFLLSICLAASVVDWGTSAAPFSIEVIDAPSHVFLGMPVVPQLRVKNTSGMEQALPFFSMTVWMDLIESPEGPENWFPKERGFRREQRISSPEEGRKAPLEWKREFGHGFAPPCAGTYKFRFILSSKPSGRMGKLMGELPEHWVGEVSTEPITVVVRKPEGIDGEAFDMVCRLRKEHGAHLADYPAGCYQMSVWPPGEPTGARTLLLTKYRDSIYASYEIYKSYRNNWIWSLDLYEQPGNLSSIWGYTQCDSSAMPDRGMKESRKLIGKEYLRCQEQWLQIALENHPDTWFSDDIRLILAGDAYLLGDKDRCRSLLEGLVAKGRPYVASMAQDLLDGMIEKDMLPAPTPKPGFAGVAAR